MVKAKKPAVSAVSNSTKRRGRANTAAAPPLIRDLYVLLHRIDVPATASQQTSHITSSATQSRRKFRSLTDRYVRDRTKVFKQHSQRQSASQNLRVIASQLSGSQANVVARVSPGAEQSQRQVNDVPPMQAAIPRVTMAGPAFPARLTQGNEVIAVHQPAPQAEDAAAPPPAPRARIWGENIPHKRTWKYAVNTEPGLIEQKCGHPFLLGALTVICTACGAKFFQNEFISRQGSLRICCKNAAIVLPRLADTPRELMALFTGNGAQCDLFREKLRYLNGLFAMASFKTSVPGGDRVANAGRCFAVTGQVFHYFNGVPNTQDLDEPRLNHYYFLDVAEAMAHRTAYAADSGVDRELLEVIETVLRRVNPYMRAYLTISEQLAEEKRRRPRGDPLDNVYIGLLDHMNRQRRNYNLPESRSDIAALFVGEEPPFRVDLMLRPKARVAVEGQQRCHVISSINKLADPMVYPLLFPNGDEGRNLDVRSVTDGKSISARQYYRYRIQIRDGFSNIHYGQKLFQQYIVDAWCKAESDTLFYLRKNQVKFRLAAQESLDRYNRRRAAAGEAAGPEERIGRPVILPVSFIGGEKNIERRYAEAMAVIARFGKPDLLITFTCNPRWPEISTALPPHQRWEHRPDLVCRVFSAKLKEFMNDISQKQLYGVVLSYHYVIEFQKRGLPHAHIVLTFTQDDKIQSSDDVDGIVAAYIPDRFNQPELYARVAQHQLHSACAINAQEAPCIVEGQCRFKFPMDFAERTLINRGSNQRPQYKRPRDGRTVDLVNHNVVIDNTRVVPYNALTLAKYNCHINFEVVGSIKSMKYLHKYLAKGVDSIRVDVDAGNDLDEIQRYLNCRYVSSIEAAWRLFEFKMFDRSHSVTLLPVHLPGFRDVFFDEDDDVDHVQAALDKPSKLEAFFLLNAETPEARDLLYCQIPEYYLWNTRGARWIARRASSKMIGTVYEVSPNDPQIDKFYLRILLLHVRGPTSFEHLRTVNNDLCPDFKTACDRRNLLRNGVEYDRCMAEALIRKLPCRLRRLFATICAIVTDDDLAQIPRLWHKYKLDMIEDYRHRGLNYRDSIMRCFQVVEGILASGRQGATLAQLGVILDDDDLRIIAGEDRTAVGLEVDDLDRDLGGQGPVVDYGLDRLNIDQKTIFIKIVHAIRFLKRYGPLPLDTYLDLMDVPASVLGDRSKLASNVFYLDGPGGTGKTYLYNTILHYVQKTMSMTTVAVAWTGIAANLLIGGKTVHKTFKLPLNLTDRTVAGWPLEHGTSRYLRNVALVVWDEAPMTPKLAVDAIDRYFRELMDNHDLPFGGKCFVFGGDFRQILPVVKGAGDDIGRITGACLKGSHLWSKVTQLRLGINMRSSMAVPAADHARSVIAETKAFGCPFSEWLLQLGEGKLPYVNIPNVPHAPRNLIEIPNQLLVDSLDALIDFVYENMEAECGQRAILCPTNSAVNFVNDVILDRLQGQLTIYSSIDEYRQGAMDNFHVPLDIVNAVELPSLPPHELRLKPGSIVMLLRNVDVTAGQCNGTRMKVVSLAVHFVECEILSGTSKGKVAFIPKMKMVAEDSMLPQPMSRFQFPLRLAFCMTINKAQGQTFTKVGILLKTPCFTHGQLYVAFSRVGRPENLRCFVECGPKQGSFRHKSKKRFTSNIVFYDVIGNTGRLATRVQVNEDPLEDVDPGEGDEARPASPLITGSLLNDARHMDTWSGTSVEPGAADNRPNVRYFNPTKPTQSHNTNTTKRNRPDTYSDLESCSEDELSYNPPGRSSMRNRVSRGDRPGTSCMPIPSKRANR